MLLIAAAFQIDLEIGRRGYEAALYGKPAKNANRLRLHLVDTVSLGPDIGEVADPREAWIAYETIKEILYLVIVMPTIASGFGQVEQGAIEPFFQSRIEKEEALPLPLVPLCQLDRDQAALLYKT